MSCYVIVRLHDTQYPGGPATVIATTDSVDEYHEKRKLRDGAHDDTLRLWGNDAGSRVGDVVQLGIPEKSK